MRTGGYHIVDDNDRLPRRDGVRLHFKLVLYNRVTNHPRPTKKNNNHVSRPRKSSLPQRKQTKYEMCPYRAVLFLVCSAHTLAGQFPAFAHWHKGCAEPERDHGAQ